MEQKLQLKVTISYIIDHVIGDVKDGLSMIDVAIGRVDTHSVAKDVTSRIEAADGVEAADIDKIEVLEMTNVE